MQKKSLLALLVAVMMLMSGCALVTVDEEADNAQIIIDVNGTTIDKGTFNALVENTIAEYEYMNQMYSYLGMQASFPTDTATVQQEVLNSNIQSIVTTLKAQELGYDQLTAEEEAAALETAEQNYADYVQQVIDAYFADSELEEEALHAEAEKYIAENGLADKEYFLDSAKQNLAMEKLYNDTVKDVAVTEEDLTAALNEKVEAEKAEYESYLDYYGSAVNNGTQTYYAPAGYRYVKHILVKFAEEDATAITEKETALTEASTALTTAQQALTAAAEGADTTELKAAADAAQVTVDEATAALEAAKETARQNIKAKVDEVYALATAEGADFDALVAQYNEDTGMPAIGYAICEGYAYFVESFTAAGMALENVGDVSEPVESTYGYHIMQYSAEIPEGPVALEDVRADLEAEVLTTKQDAAYTEAVNQWVSEADVKTYTDRLN